MRLSGSGLRRFPANRRTVPHVLILRALKKLMDSGGAPPRIKARKASPFRFGAAFSRRSPAALRCPRPYLQKFRAGGSMPPALCRLRISANSNGSSYRGLFCRLRLFFIRLPQRPRETWGNVISRPVARPVQPAGASGSSSSCSGASAEIVICRTTAPSSSRV